MMDFIMAAIEIFAWVSVVLLSIGIVLTIFVAFKAWEFRQDEKNETVKYTTRWGK